MTANYPPFLVREISSQEVERFNRLWRFLIYPVQYNFFPTETFSLPFQNGSSLYLGEKKICESSKRCSYLLSFDRKERK